MEFTISHADAELDGSLVYAESDHAFGFQVGSPMVLRDLIEDMGVTSLSIDTLQIEVAVATRVVLFVWGLHPRARWRTEILEPPSARPGRLRVADSVPLEAGVSVELASGVTWLTTYDPATGWVRVADVDNLEADDRVLIATGTVVGLLEGKINSVWLQPDIRLIDRHSGARQLRSPSLGFVFERVRLQTRTGWCRMTLTNRPRRAVDAGS